MYNAERKEMYIQEYTTSIGLRQFATWVFNSTEQFEENYGNDICNLPFGETSSIVDEVSGLRVVSQNRPLKILRDYVAWCSRNGFETTESIFEIKDIGLSKVKRQTIRNPKHLQIILNTICDPESELTTDNNIRTYLWLAYSGMKNEDIFCVKESDVDFDIMKIRYGQKLYPIYTESLDAIRNCVNSRQYNYKHSNYTKDCVRDRVPGDILIRGIRSVPSITSMRAEISTRCKRAIESGKMETELSYYRVWLSGIFYQMYELEQCGIPVDFSGVVLDKLDGKLFKLDSSRNTQESKRDEIARHYKADYERWKQTLL